MTKISAGILMFRINNEQQPEFFLVHPGGPYFKNKDTGVWTIPKGEPEEGEELRDTAVREFCEESGIKPSEDLMELGKIKQKGGKIVVAWGFEFQGEALPELKCNLFTVQWPPGSGRVQSFPEVDQWEFFPYQDAVKKINQAQVPFLDIVIQELQNRRRHTR